MRKIKETCEFEIELGNESFIVDVDFTFYPGETFSVHSASVRPPDPPEYEWQEVRIYDNVRGKRGEQRCVPSWLESTLGDSDKCQDAMCDAISKHEREDY